MSEAVVRRRSRCPLAALAALRNRATSRFACLMSFIFHNCLLIHKYTRFPGPCQRRFIRAATEGGRCPTGKAGGRLRARNLASAPHTSAPGLRSPGARPLKIIAVLFVAQGSDRGSFSSLTMTSRRSRPHPPPPSPRRRTGRSHSPRKIRGTPLGPSRGRAYRPRCTACSRCRSPTHPTASKPLPVGQRDPRTPLPAVPFGTGRRDPGGHLMRLGAR